MRGPANFRLRLVIEWLVIATLSSLAVVLASQWRGTAAFDNLFYDQLTSFARPAADPKVVIVTIDDSSLSALGQWPWPRSTHAALIDKIQQTAPRSILFDVLLSEPSDEVDDGALAAAMKTGAPVYVPIHFVSPGTNGKAFDVVPPIEILGSAASGTGHVNVEFDGDGVVRRAILCFSPDELGSRYPHIVELVARNNGKPTPAYTRNDSCNRAVLIPYSKRGSFIEIPFVNVLNGEIPAEVFKGKDVIIGATAAGMGDAYPVPMADGGLLSGAEIMANMLGAIRRDDFVEPLPGLANIVLSLLPLWLLLVGFLRWRPRLTLTVSLALVVAMLAVSALLLRWQIWFPPGAAILGLLLVYPLWGWRRLQAMSDFMETELKDLTDSEPIGLPVQSRLGDDMVGRQSTALAGAIDQLHSLRRFVADILSDLPDPLVVTDLRGNIMVVNDELERRMGHSPVGENIAAAFEQQITHRVRGDVLEYFQDQNQASDEEIGSLRLVSSDGRTLVLRRSILHGEGERSIGHIHYFTDISALARAEADREQALQLLSHDMRAPQSAIIAMLPDLRDAKARSRIERHARRTMQLAQDFVDIARMGESAFEGTDLLLAELARDVADSLWPLAKERGIVIDVKDHAGDAFVFAEADSLSRALTNLVDNAIKHSPDNGKIRIDVARIADHQLELRIHDEGKGIDPEIASQLFTRFASGTEGTSRVKSVGLGLAFVRAVAERHNGSVRAENLQSGGACFTLTMPEAAEDDAG
jgi:CHASE2 domain-containing sensor protein/signal transduction histidine kinase